jgi:hypothetical protein
VSRLVDPIRDKGLGRRRPARTVDLLQQVPPAVVAGDRGSRKPAITAQVKRERAIQRS